MNPRWHTDALVSIVVSAGRIWVSSCCLGQSSLQSVFILFLWFGVAQLTLCVMELPPGVHDLTWNVLDC